MCTCISTCTSVYLTLHICFTTLAYLHEKMSSSVWHCVCLPVTLLVVPHLDYNAYMHQYMYFCLPDSPYLLHPICILTWKDGFLCVALCVSSIHLLQVPHHLQIVHMHQYINLCPYLTAHVCSTQCEQFHENMGVSVWHFVFVTINLFLVTHLC